MENPLYDYRARLLARLESVVGEIGEAIAVIPERQWRTRRGDGRSPHLILSSLCAVERLAYLPRLRRLIAEDLPTLKNFDPDRWQAGQYDPTIPMAALLADYAGLRESELQLLRALSPAGWARAGRHPAFGLRTVQWWAERILEHSMIHLRELRGNDQ
jgi:hypothetical protein